VLNPALAADHARTLVAIAAAGDFYEFTNPAAVQIDLVIQAFEDPERSPLRTSFAGASEQQIEQMASDELLGLMPDLLDNPAGYEELWREGYAEIVRRLSWVNEGRVTVREWPAEALSTIETPEVLDHYARNLFTNGHRILEVVPQDEGTSYVLRYREFLWYDIVSRTTTPTHLMTRAADRLNELEPASTRGSWAVTNWTPALLFTAHPTRETRVVKHKEPRGASALPVETVERVIREELADLDKRTSAR
jgi:hypothetical protein